MGSGFQASPSFRHARDRPFDLSALVILVQRHALTTDTTPSSGGVPTGPPPGFNAQEAKKPLPLSRGQNIKNATPPSPVKKPTAPQVFEVPQDEATAVAKTATVEKEGLTEVAEKAAEIASGEQLTETKKEAKKLTIMQKIKKEIMHYWDGTKLLATEVKISTKLALKMAAGYELSRREDRQVGSLPRSS